MQWDAVLETLGDVHWEQFQRCHTHSRNSAGSTPKYTIYYFQKTFGVNKTA